MDKAVQEFAIGGEKQFSRTPPWRLPTYNQNHQSFRRSVQTQPNPGLVDSWRSYKNDLTTLQTQNTGPLHLNAAAPDFVPSGDSLNVMTSRYTSYQPLRVSNGSAERATIEAVKNQSRPSKKDKKRRQKQLTNATSEHVAGSMSKCVQPTSDFAARYPVRRTRGLSTAPIPSVEPADQVLLPQRRFASTSQRHSTKSPEAPEVSAEYRLAASKSPVRLSHSRKLLVILDLNGTLLYRNKARTGAKVHMRPGVTPLLDYLFSNHVVMVYTSAMPATAVQMVSQFLHPKYRSKLAATWARDKLDLTLEQFNNKVQVYKKLGKVWNDEKIQQTAPDGTKWDQSNTILIDDSKVKAKAQPHNLVQVSEYTHDQDPAASKNKPKHKELHKIQCDILRQLEMKLEELRWQEDVSRLIRRWQRGEIQAPSLPGQQVVIDETVDQKLVKQDKAERISTTTQSKTHLPSPETLREGDSSDRNLEPGDEDGDDNGAPLSPVSSVGESVFQELLRGADDSKT